MRRSSVALFTLILSACGGDGQSKGEAASGFEIDSAALTKTASGLRYQDVVIGTGPEATAGQVAIVHYSGWLTDGTQFDSSRAGDSRSPSPWAAAR